MYRIHEIKLGLGESVEKLPEKILKKIGAKGGAIGQWTIVKESIDARDKTNIKKVYSVDFEVVSIKAPNKKITLAVNNKLKLELARMICSYKFNCYCAEFNLVPCRNFI